MLRKLQQLHQEILSCLDEMDGLTKLPQPPMDRLPALRQSLTRSSRARTMLLEGIYDRLITEASPAKKGAIEALRVEGKNNLTTSTQHIGSWTLRQVTAHWPDYCAASARMRADMRRRVRSEMELIYPLLSSAAE